jgi:large subunit ribosomal protein L21
MMFAVIKTGGKQFRVAANDEITIAKLVGEPGDTVAFGEVLMLTDGDKSTVGAPFLGDITVAGEIVKQARGEKVIAFKKRRRQNSKRKRGFRAELTIVRITDILTGGKKPEMKKGDASAVALKAASTATKGKAAPKAAKAEAGEALDASNLSLISGVGPTIEKKLRAAGITSWNDIAAWSEADVAKWDEELKLRGRATREEWVEQAKELLAGKPPRAKADQAELASGEDY